jgi:hypothetical protein
VGARAIPRRAAAAGAGRPRRARRGPRARAAATLPSRLASSAITRAGVAAVTARVFPGLDAEGSAYDGGLAIGRSHVLVAQNFAVAIFDKASGAKLEDTNLATGRRRPSCCAR